MCIKIEKFLHSYHLDLMPSVILITRISLSGFVKIKALNSITILAKYFSHFYYFNIAVQLLFLIDFLLQSCWQTFLLHFSLSFDCWLTISTDDVYQPTSTDYNLVNIDIIMKYYKLLLKKLY